MKTRALAHFECLNVHLSTFGTKWAWKLERCSTWCWHLGVWKFECVWQVWWFFKCRNILTTILISMINLWLNIVYILCLLILMIRILLDFLSKSKLERARRKPEFWERYDIKQKNISSFEYYWKGKSAMINDQQIQEQVYFFLSPINLFNFISIHIYN